MRRVLRQQGDERLFHNDFSACDRYAGGLRQPDAWLSRPT